MAEKIRRFLDTTVRSKDTDKMEFEGYALKFNKPTQIGEGYWAYMEQISPDSMDTADLEDVVMTFNHDFNELLAGTRNDSLKLEVDEIGLKVSGRFSKAARAQDVFTQITEGLINRMSFCCYVEESEWKIDEKGEDLDVRTITKFGRFFDVSAVTFPAYEDTAIAARDENYLDKDVKRHFNHKKMLEQFEEINAILGGK